MIHEMRLDNEAFIKVKSGTKTVELRLLDEKRKAVHIGDVITFENRKDHEKIDVKVTDLFTSKDFKEIYEKYSMESLGYAEDEKASYKDMNKFYSEEEIQKYGAVAISIKKVN